MGIIKRPIDLACNYDERVCDCGSDEFFELGTTPNGEMVYACVVCDTIFYGMD